MSAYRLNVIVILVLVAFLAPKLGNAQSDQLRSRWPVDVPQRYCGRRLSNILQTVCTGVYNNMFKKNVQQEDNKTQQERSSVDTGTRRSNMFSDLEVSEYPLNYERPSLFISGEGASQFINHHYRGSRVRKERGIYEECCLNGCTFSELYTYCGPPQ